MILTDEERKKFAQYLDMDASVDSGFVEQLKQMGPHMEAVIKQKKIMITAKRIVATWLLNAESATIGGTENEQSE